MKEESLSPPVPLTLYQTTIFLTGPYSKHLQMTKYGISCIQRPLKGSNESGLFQQVVFKCRFFKVDLAQTSPEFYVPAVKVFWKHWGKWRNCS